MFSICYGLVIFIVSVADFFVRDMLTGLGAIEMFISGGGFAAYLIGLSTYCILQPRTKS